MTREIKLALIVGFSLVLVVAVVISDHMSKARQAQLSPADSADRVALAASRQPETSDPVVIPREPEVASEPAPSPAPVHQPLAINQGRGASLPDSASVSSQAGGEQTNPEETRTQSPGATQIVNSDDDRPLIDEILRQGGNVLTDGQGRIIDTGPLAKTDTGDLRRLTLTPEPVSGNPIAAQPNRVVAEPPILPPTPSVTHVVSRGESAFVIAKRYFGRGNDWPRLRDANPGKVSPDGAVREGARLLIPGAVKSATPTVRPAPAPGGPRVAINSPTLQPEPKASRSYTIQKGDSLGVIAQKQLGSAKRKGEIIALNTGVIKNENDIRAGQVIKLPS